MPGLRPKYFRCSQGRVEAGDGDEQVFVVFGFADGGGDVLEAGLTDEPAGEVTEGGEVAGPVPGADFGVVFTQGSVADPVDGASHCSLTVGGWLEQAVLGGW